MKRLKHTYVVTGPYADMYIEPMSKEELKRAGGYDVQKREAFLLGTGDEKVSLTTMSE